MCSPKKKESKYKDFTLNVAGEYIYSGDYLEYSEGNPLPYAKMRIILPVLVLASAGAALASGLFAAPGTSDRFYVILPLTATIACALLSAYSALRYAAVGNPMRRFDYDAFMKSFPVRLKACAIFAAITLIAYFVHLIMNGIGGYGLWAVLLFPSLVAACGVASGAASVLAERQVWVTQEITKK